MSHIKQMSNEEQYQERVEDLKRQLTRAKEEAKGVTEKVAEAERVLRKNHEQYVSKQEKLRELEQKLAAGKERLRNKKPVPTVTPDMISELEEQIAGLEEERRDNERLWQGKMRAIDLEFEQKKLEEEKKLLILREREKEFRLNELKIKELRKLVRHNMTTEAVKRPDVDLSQFRHKRNIKYLER